MCLCVCYLRLEEGTRATGVGGISSQLRNQTLVLWKRLAGVEGPGQGRAGQSRACQLLEIPGCDWLSALTLDQAWGLAEHRAREGYVPGKQSAKHSLESVQADQDGLAPCQGAEDWAWEKMSTLCLIPLNTAFCIIIASRQTIFIPTLGSHCDMMVTVG